MFFGDSNIDAIQKVCFQGLSALLHSCDYKNCHNLVTRPCSKSSIDHVYSNLQCYFQIDSVICSLTGHNITYCIVVLSRTRKVKITLRVRRHCNYERAKKYINNSLNMPSLTGNPSNDTSLFLTCVSNDIASATVKTKLNKTTVI